MENAITARKMTYKEARECADRINTNMTNIRHLVLALYEREGWSALGYKSWRECVVVEFKQGQAYLYRQLEAAQTERNISTIVENVDQIPESQLQPLTKLRDDPAAQCEAWQQAVATAPDGKVTAAHVNKIVKEMTAPEKPVTDHPQTDTNKLLPSYAVEFAITAISHLERIRRDDPKREEAFRMIISWINEQRKVNKGNS